MDFENISTIIIYYDLADCVFEDKICLVTNCEFEYNLQPSHNLVKNSGGDISMEIQNKKWLYLFLAELVIVSFLFIGISIFAEQLGIDSGGNWGPRRILVLIIGFAGCLISQILFFNRKNINIVLRFTGFSRYINSLLVWVLLYLVLIEILVRIFVRGPTFQVNEKDWGIVYAPSTVVYWAKEGLGFTHYLSHNEIVAANGIGDISVVVLGDSHTEAWQVGDEFNYVSMSERKLIHNSFSVVMHNLSKSNYSVADYVYLAPLVQKYYKPKIVVIQLSPQDFSGIDGGDAFNSKHPNYFISDKNGVLQLNHKTYSFIGGLFDQILSSSMIYTVGNEKLSGLFSNANRTPPQSNIEVSSNANTIASSSKMRDQLTALKHAYSENIILLVCLPQKPDIEGDTIVSIDKENQKIVDTAREIGGFQIINPQEQFDQLVPQGFFPRGFMNSTSPAVGHLNIMGHQIVGDLLSQKIEEVLR